MKTQTRTITERIGENMGAIDWSYDFRSHFDCMGTSSAGKDERCEQAKRWLKRVEAEWSAGHPVRVTNDGGSPRCAIYPVIDIGMYDGYPYWRPVPSVQVRTWAGAEWYSFDRITDVYLDESGESLGQVERRAARSGV